MNKRGAAGVLLLIALALAWAVVRAEQTVLEVITLKYRNAEQVVPVLKPLLATGGTISGMDNRVIVRTTPQNLAELRKVLDVMDAAPRRLMISVKQDNAGSDSAHEAEISGSIGDDRARASVPGAGGSEGATVEIGRRDNRARARVLQSQSASTDRSVQTLQVLEGNQAFIRVGQSVPVRNRNVIQTPQGAQISESVEYRDADTGFYVSPRVSGDRVTLSISTRRDSPADRNSETFNVQRVDTVVSGRLGEWLEIGGIGQESVRRDSGTVYRRSNIGFDDRRVYLKVEQLP